VTAPAARSVLRQRDGHHARVGFEELFFDLVYVFAVTQLAHLLLHHLSWTGAVETLILWFAVWLGWQYTSWMTNWFDPETPRIRALLFGIMLLALLMAASLPEAFGTQGLLFAAIYATMQVMLPAWVLLHLPRAHALAANYRRILGWMLIAAGFWIAGAFADHTLRVALWGLAVLSAYVSPMIGFALPGLGRSRTQDWTIEGGHLAERCGLFVIVALGETVLASGASLARTGVWNADTVLALVSTFASTLALWWLYFGTSSKAATRVITQSADPGRIGAYFHYAHVILVAGIIVTAVGHDLVMGHPHDRPAAAQLVALLAGPAIYLLGSAVYKKVVYGVVPMSHVTGALVMLGIGLTVQDASLLVTGGLTTIVLLAAGLWEARMCRQQV
jgi:low temperature requirement protein LtrA